MRKTLKGELITNTTHNQRHYVVFSFLIFFSFLFCQVLSTGLPHKLIEGFSKSFTYISKNGLQWDPEPFPLPLCAL